MKLGMKLRKFWKDEEGANGVEYALLAGLIAIAFVVGAGLLGGALNTFLSNVATCVTTPSQATCSAPFGGGGGAGA
jgi:pilus assembly protein Flp/PilA